MATPADCPEVVRWWRLLGTGLGKLVEVRMIPGGASGSGVHVLHVAPTGSAVTRAFVLKVAADPDTRDQARRELHFYRELAARVPVTTPTFAAGLDDGDHVCLLLDDAGTAARPVAWAHERWERLAAELGQLHHERVAAATADWAWAKQKRPAPESAVSAAARGWAELGYRPLGPLWPRLEDLTAALGELPGCLCHGDWHLGNILAGRAGTFVWIDWQEVGYGHGPEDLVLLWQRAEFDGLDPPRNAMLTAYARARAISDTAPLRRAAIAAELMLLLISWPPYLRGAPESARARMLRRLSHLADAWTEGSRIRRL
jgi:Ser/Thr protein kinase RdoA (MazF antagonist)